MRCNSSFRNDRTKNVRETPAFHNKSTLNLPQVHPALDMFLSQMEGDAFSFLPGNTIRYNLTKEKQLAIRGLAEDCSNVIKPADKDSCVLCWIGQITY